MTIRRATADDLDDLLRLVQALAAYEKEPDAAVATHEDFRSALFPEDGAPTTYAHVAEHEGQIVGMAIWFVSFSTWTGKNGIWLEDLFVDPAQRGHGHGLSLLRALASECVSRGWTRLEWCVLNWNTPAIDFYAALGSTAQSEWHTRRLDGDALTRLAAQ